MPPKKILLVEDDPFLSSLLKSRLSKEGFALIYAADGEEALALAQKEKPDLVLLDLILPKKSGFEVLEVMRLDPRLEKTPIMIVSNLGQDSDMVRGRELGAIAYFIKAKTSIDLLVKEIKDFFSKAGQ
ncbi:MAG: response regulator [Candidatus Liptonbacteria bacterium]|nr:response regulator [Candidatus Liptonbacteria bacterium]